MSHHPSQKKDNFFKGVKRKWFKEDNNISIRRNYDNYYNREFITVRNGNARPSIESLSVTQLVIGEDSTKKSNPHKNTILSNWTTEIQNDI